MKALSQPGLPRQDIQGLSLEVEVDKQRKKTGCLSTTNFELPEDLPSVEEQLKRLELEVVVRQIQQTTTSIVMPKDLPSVEEALKKLAAAMKALETPGLSKTEVTRLRSLIQATGAYQVRFAEYVNYRGLEKGLVELEEKYEELVKREKLKEES